MPGGGKDRQPVKINQYLEEDAYSLLVQDHRGEQPIVSRDSQEKAGDKEGDDHPPEGVQEKHPASLQLRAAQQRD